MSGQENRLLGRWGERCAASYLRQQGYQIVAANWRCRFGEIDLIAQYEGFLCFVEVKLRKNARFGSAGAFVDVSKQRKLTTTAQLYLAEHPSSQQPRFDVLEIYAPQGMQTKQPEIYHIKNAF